MTLTTEKVREKKKTSSSGRYICYYWHPNKYQRVYNYCYSSVIASIAEIADACSSTDLSVRQMLTKMLRRGFFKKLRIPGDVSVPLIFNLPGEEDVDPTKSKAELVFDREIRYLQDRRRKLDERREVERDF